MNLRAKYRSVAALDGRPYKGGFAFLGNGWQFIGESTLRGLLRNDGLPQGELETFITNLLGCSFVWDDGMVYFA